MDHWVCYWHCIFGRNPWCWSGLSALWKPDTKSTHWECVSFRRVASMWLIDGLSRGKLGTLESLKWLVFPICIVDASLIDCKPTAGARNAVWCDLPQVPAKSWWKQAARRSLEDLIVGWMLLLLPTHGSTCCQNHHQFAPYPRALRLVSLPVQRQVEVED